MTPEEFAAELKQACGDAVCSVMHCECNVPAEAMADASTGRVVVVARSLSYGDLKQLAPHVVEWCRSGNIPPQLCTTDELFHNCAVDPLRALDMKECCKVLAGEDVLKEFRVDKRELRHQVLTELRRKLAVLRERFLLTLGKDRNVVGLLMESFSDSLPLMRAALRLYEETPLQNRTVALGNLSRHIAFDMSVFSTLNDIDQGQLKWREIGVEELFRKYLENLEVIIAAVNSVDVIGD